MNIKTIKPALLNECKKYVDQRFSLIQETINRIQESLTSETKSSAGDKHETGRAMLQLEREKAGKQLSEAQKLQEIVHKIDVSSSHTNIHLGSLVITTQGNYFIGISIGQVNIEETSYFIIAANTPIGKLLLGKKIGESIVFNDRKIEIKEIY